MGSPAPTQRSALEIALHVRIRERVDPDHGRAGLVAGMAGVDGRRGARQVGTDLGVVDELTVPRTSAR